MKKISKLLCIVLCLSMLMGLALVANAEDAAATIGFADKANRTSFSTELQVWEANGIKVINDRNGAYSPVGDYANPARFYKSTSLTIEYVGMTKLVITTPTADHAKAWVDSNQDTNATVSYDGTIVTVVFAAPANSFTLAKLSAQTRISELAVYANASAPEIPEEPEQPEQPENTIVDIKTAVDAASGDFTVKGVVTCVDSSNIYVQDATGGICVRMATKPTDIALGDTIIGTGTKAVYNGMPQLGNATYEKSEGAALAPKATTIAALTAADVCTYVTISGLTVTEIFDNDGQYSSPNVTVTDGTNEIQIYKAAVDKVDGAWAIKVGDVIDVTAAVGIHKTTLQLRNTLGSEIVLNDGDDNEDPETPDVPEIPETPDVTIVDIKVALDATTGDFTVKGVVTLIDGKNLYVQDTTGAICVRMPENVEGVALGDTVIAGGSRSDYFGAPQLGNGTYEKSEGVELVAKETTIAGLTRADLYSYVKLTDLTITEIYDKDGTYSVPNITLTDGTNEIQLYKAVIDKNEDGSWEYAVGDKIDVLAAVGCYNETLQLRNTLSDEVTISANDSEDNTEGDDVETPEDPDDDTEDIPQTSDVSVVAAALVAACATCGLVVLTKKEQF